ncbi:MAG: ABC transporter permease [Deltaproteobacteria bacterium]|nr:ABC transporter permease [Deltaproteobacteria bacterium]
MIGGHFVSNALAIAYKEATALRHDRAFLAAVISQPIMIMLLFGFALSNEPANVPWAVLDQSRTAESRRFLEAVRTTGYFLPAMAVDSYEAGEALLKRGRAVAFVIIPADFRRDMARERPQVQVLLDGTDPLTAARVGGYISQVGASFRGDREPPPKQPPLVRGRFLFNPTLKDSTFFLSALAGMLLTNLCLSVTTLGIVGERESGTYEHMLSTPTTSLEIVLGKLLPHVVICYAVLTFATLATGAVFGVWPRGSWLALYLVTLPFTLASLSIGVFVSTLAANSAQAVFIGVFVILPSFVLSGSLFPYQLMPLGVREVGYLLPLRWYQISLRRVIERGAGLSDIAGPFLMLCLLFGGMLLLIRWRLKPRLA